MAVFDKRAFIVSEQLMGEVADYIGAHYVDMHRFRPRNLLYVEEQALAKENVQYAPSMEMEVANSLADLVEHLDEPFSDTLLKLIDLKGKFDVIVECFIISRKYNIFDINEVLFQYDQPLLGS